MEKIIHLKQKPFEKVKTGKKKFEVRLGNKEINEGDLLIMKEIDEKGKETGNEIKKKVTHVESTKDMHHWQASDINKFGYKIIQLE